MINGVPRCRLPRAHSPDSEHRAARHAPPSTEGSRGVARHDLVSTPFDAAVRSGLLRPRKARAAWRGATTSSHAVRRSRYRRTLPTSSAIARSCGVARHELVHAAFDVSRGGPANPCANERDRSQACGQPQRSARHCPRPSCPRAGEARDVMRWLATGQLGGAAKQKWLPPAQRGHRNSGLN